jgi:hypothetical protein
MTVSLPRSRYPGPNTVETKMSCVHLVKLVFSWLISYPLAGLLKTIPDSRPDLKNGYVIL